MHEAQWLLQSMWDCGTQRHLAPSLSFCAQSFPGHSIVFGLGFLRCYVMFYFKFKFLHCQLFKQEGWLSPMERASVSAISLRHILASPGYAPGTIAVNVKRMKMLIKCIAACTNLSLTYCNCFLPVAFNAPAGVFPLEFREKVWSSEN